MTRRAIQPRQSITGRWQQRRHSHAHQEAISAYSRALELASDMQLTSEQLGQLYARRGRAMELIGQFEQAIRNDDDMLAAAQSRHDRRVELEARTAASTLYSTPTSVVDPARGRQLSEETLKLAVELGDQAVEARVMKDERGRRSSA